MEKKQRSRLGIIWIDKSISPMTINIWKKELFFILDRLHLVQIIEDKKQPNQTDAQNKKIG
jgi:hypothetical protein